MPSPVLYLEDVASDAQLAMAEFRRMGVGERVMHMRDGGELLSYLQGIDEPLGGRRNPVPALVILDLGLPEIHGMQLLNMLRSRRSLRRIPVVIFSGSEDPSVISAAYDAGACSFVWKSGEITKFRNALHSIVEYWTKLNRVPGENHSQPHN
ncbi:MAG TPA: response regulator [Candidatus Limnocylindrales bacterium]|jgi:CheY-like chemotaxis protein|nr:response regulator [Candidatus Limnocylindrales bacterium]